MVTDTADDNVHIGRIEVAPKIGDELLKAVVVGGIELSLAVSLALHPEKRDGVGFLLGWRATISSAGVLPAGLGVW